MAKVTNCPHCGSALQPHEGVNEGFAHCNSCGCCFVEATGELRPGSQACNPESAKLMAESATTTDDVKEMQQEIKTLKQQLEAKDKDIEDAIKEGTVAASKVIADNDEAMKALKKEHEDEIKALKAEHDEALKAAKAPAATTPTPNKPEGDNK